MKIKEMNSSLVTLVNFEEIPIIKLLHDPSIDLLKNEFSFNKIDIQQRQKFSPPTIICEFGELINNSEKILIERIEIEQRKIVVKVNSDSSNADEVFNKLKSFMANIVEYDLNDFLKPIIRTYESLIIARLDIFAKDIIHPKLIEFIDKRVLEEAKIKEGDVIQNFFTQHFRLDYLLSEEKFKDYRIDLNSKDFYVTPRDGMPLEDQIYISEAPLTTTKHIKLLEEFELLFAN